MSGTCKDGVIRGGDFMGAYDLSNLRKVVSASILKMLTRVSRRPGW